MSESRYELPTIEIVAGNNLVCTIRDDSLGEVVDAYIISGKTPSDEDWLSYDNTTTSLSPATGIMYHILSDGDFYGTYYCWDGDEFKKMILLFSMIGYSSQYGSPLVSKQFQIVNGGITININATDTLTLSGKYVYQITTMISRDADSINCRQGLCFVNRNIDTDYIRKVLYNDPEEVVGLTTITEMDANIIGATPYAADWLADILTGAVIIPQSNYRYVVSSSADAQYNHTYTWDGTTYQVYNA